MIGARAHESRGEAYLPFAAPRLTIRDATHIRSTWLIASQASLRERGHGERYAALLPPEQKERLLSIIAGLWLPMEIARVHYASCDLLELSTAELVDIGMGATRRANAAALSFALRVARGAGVTPWTILAQLQRVFDRACMGGGGVAVWKLGPKEARVEIAAFPLAGIRYNRVTFRGILAALAELFCEKIYVKEIPELCDHRSLGFRLSWV